MQGRRLIQIPELLEGEGPEWKFKLRRASCPAAPPKFQGRTPSKHPPLYTQQSPISADANDTACLALAMFVSKLGARAGRLAGPGTPSARLFASSLPKAVSRDVPPKPKVDHSPHGSAPPASPPSVPSSVPSTIKTGLKQSSASSSSSVASSSTLKKPSFSSSPGLPAILSTSSTTIPTVLSEDWLFGPRATRFHTSALVDPDAPDSSLWELETEITTWFPPSHPHINRLTPAQLHSNVLASSTNEVKLGVFDEDEDYFGHAIFRELALSHLSNQATPDAGVSVEGKKSIRLLKEYRKAVQTAVQMGDALDKPEERQIYVDSVLRKRKKKMSKHKYKKRIKVRFSLFV